MNIDFESLENAHKVNNKRVEEIHAILANNFDGIPSRNRVITKFHDDNDIWHDTGTIPDGTSIVRAIKFGEYSLLIHHPQWNCKKPLLFQQTERYLAERIQINIQYQKSLVSFLKSLPDAIRQEIAEIERITKEMIS